MRCYIYSRTCGKKLNQCTVGKLHFLEMLLCEKTVEQIYSTVNSSFSPISVALNVENFSQCLFIALKFQQVAFYYSLC